MSERRGNIDDEWIKQFEYETEAFNRQYMLGAYERDYAIEDMLVKASYEIADAKMAITDPVWGREIIGDQPFDQLLIELARTPAFRRLQSIEQLSLGEQYATMPNSMYFSRWQHIWGSLVFVRKMTEGDDRFDDRQKMVLQLRTLLSDVGHTAFSHLGDWIFQSVGGTEDLHDRDLVDLLQATGIEDTLNKYDFSVEETVFPDVEDWVECPSPNLCVDRVDYGLREILRWVAPSIPLHRYANELANPRSLFEIADDGTLTITDQRFARFFAAGFSILPTEHWSHPVHRLQLQFLQNGVQSSIIDKLGIDFSTHPRELLFAIDDSFYDHFSTWEQIHLNRTMRGIARDQRQIFVTARREDLSRIFTRINDDNWTFPDFPDPLKSYTWQSREYGAPYPSNLIINTVKSATTAQTFAAGPDGLHVTLPALKPRAVDPMVALPGGMERFSSLEPSYHTYLEQQRQIMNQTYEAVVLMRPDIAERIVQNHLKMSGEWKGLLTRPRSREKLQGIVQDIASLAAVRRFDNIYEVDDEDFTDEKIIAARALQRRPKQT